MNVATGAGVGAYMDKQEAKLRAQLQGTGVSVTRNGDNLILNMPGNITFKTASADLNASFYKVLDSVSLVLKEFDKTLIDVEGHTDSDGADDYNMRLSQDRANSVGSYLQSRGVNHQRIVVPTAPMAAHDLHELLGAVVAQVVLQHDVAPHVDGFGGVERGHDVPRRTPAGERKKRYHRVQCHSF